MISTSHVDVGWNHIALTSVMCAMGCLTIYLDHLYNYLCPRFLTKRYPFTLLNNYAFLIASLALSSGCLILTALFKMMPSTYRYLYKSYYPSVDAEDGSHEQAIQIVLSVCFVGGMVLCSGLNALIHILTSESVVHCSHGGEPETGLESHSAHSHSHDINHGANFDSHHDHHHGSEPQLSLAEEGLIHATESTLLLASLHKKKSLVDVLSRTFHKPKVHQAHSHAYDGTVSDEGECMGYQSAEVCVFEQKGKSPHPALHFCEVPGDMVDLRLAVSNQPLVHTAPLEGCIPPTPCEGNSLDATVVGGAVEAETYSETPRAHHLHHHHHITPPLSRLLSISLQTTIAITLHKLPEGFITFVTSDGGEGEEQALGFSIFISLVIHNFVEGFSMTLPLYYSLGSRAKAIAITGTLSVLSQPMGALLGVIFMNKVYNGDRTITTINFVFGVLMGITSGFLTTISLQMFASAISFGGSHRFVLTWSIVGMSVVMLSYILMAGV